MGKQTAPPPHQRQSLRGSLRQTARCTPHPSTGKETSPLLPKLGARLSRRARESAAEAETAPAAAPAAARVRVHMHVRVCAARRVFAQRLWGRGQRVGGWVGR
eukprot:6181571-Pleurochrysis_carterae.AAC.1